MLVNTTLHTFRNNTQQENLSVINNLNINGTLKNLNINGTLKNHNRNGTLKNWSNISLFHIVAANSLR
jgi:hypothetical protein